MLTLKARNVADPFAGTIASYFMQDFPVNRSDKASVLDAVTDAIVSSNQNRFGPAPSPEHLVVIRSIIKKRIDRDEPIPMIVPWGSKKTRNTTTVDVAEMTALKQLQCLQNRVKAVYPPGVLMDLRLEDLGGFFLWDVSANDGSDTAAAVRKYMSTMIFAVRHFGLEKFITIVPESYLSTQTEFNAAAERWRGPLETFLLNPTVKNLDELHLIGWKGKFPPEQTDFYLTAYAHLYPGVDREGHLKILARYFSQAAARYELNLKLAFPEWGANYIHVSFPPPVPGMPTEMQPRRVFYRTLPLRFARSHMPPWRAKGYLVISNDSVTPKIASFNDSVVKELIPCTVDVNPGGQALEAFEFSADYLVVDQ